MRATGLRGTNEEGERGDAALRVARVSAVADEDVAAGEPDSSTTCCVCMEPWTCSGAHRIWRAGRAGNNLLCMLAHTSCGKRSKSV
ncbi:hypothetical protein U9M48_005815 [Paspalum notatum var. saurae]|uniref:Uncharacterized protein n=1 Tax=Paspalum notatum var. saurae TaxID=547442 RepID=A0AAQ3SLI3_PASNO